MALSLRILALAAATLAAGSASAQVLSPADSASSPANLSFAPPSLPTRNDASLAPDSLIAPIRPNQPLASNALIGYVNSEPIFLDDLFRPIDETLQRLAAGSRNLSEFRNKAEEVIRSQLQTLRSQILVVTAAQSSFSDNDKQMMERYLLTKRINLISSHGGSEAMAEKSLAARGSSVEKEMADEKRAFIVQMYFARNIAPRIVVTRQNLIDEYNRNPDRWHEQGSVELYTLTLPVVRWLKTPTTNGTIGQPIEHPTPQQVTAAENQAMATARSIIAQLKKGADFARLVEDNTSADWAARRGGRIPDVKPGTLTNAKLEKYVFSLPANTIGEPQLLRDPDPRLSVVTIVKIGEKKESRIIPFSEAQTDIYKELSAKQLHDLQAQYMEKLARESATEGVDRNVSLAVDAAVARYVSQ
jgi:hypothetical protein